jgi:hypothetical protein
MRSLDHADIIGTISDGQEDRGRILLDKLDDESLLQRGDSTTYYGFAKNGEFKERFGKILFQGESKTFAVDDQCKVFLLSTTSLTLDCAQTLGNEILCSRGGFLINNDLPKGSIRNGIQR